MTFLRICVVLVVFTSVAHAQTASDTVVPTWNPGASIRLALRGNAFKTHSESHVVEGFRSAVAQSKPHDSNKNGTLIGLAVGATYGTIVTAIISKAHESGEPGRRGVFILVTSVGIGTYVGWLVDEFH
jgi:hypothetical protein